MAVARIRAAGTKLAKSRRDLSSFSSGRRRRRRRVVRRLVSFRYNIYRKEDKKNPLEENAHDARKIRERENERTLGGTLGSVY